LLGVRQRVDVQFLVAYSSCKLVYMLPVMHVPGP